MKASHADRMTLGTRNAVSRTVSQAGQTVSQAGQTGSLSRYRIYATGANHVCQSISSVMMALEVVHRNLQLVFESKRVI